MQQDLNKKMNVEKIAVTNAITLEALILLLEKKGLISVEEIIKLISTMKNSENQTVN